MMTDDRLDWHLWNWQQWMHRPDSGRLWFKGRASGQFSDGWQGDDGGFDEAVKHADDRCAIAVNAIVKDLPPALSCAVHHKLLHSVFRFRHDVEACYLSARELIRKGLTRRGIM